MSKIFINLPVANLDQSIAFYTALGFSQNKDFSDANVSCMIWDDNIYVMLLTHDFARRYLPAHKNLADSHHTCEVLNALQFDSREAVDIFFNKAMDAGGKQTIDMYDHGFMYGRDFEDLDGHIWECFWMDPSYIAYS